MKYFALSLLILSAACQTSPRPRTPAQALDSASAPQIAQIPEEKSDDIDDFQIKTIRKKDSPVFLDHKFFNILYDKDHRLAKWVEYRLTKADLQLVVGKRRNKFHPDTLLKKMNIDPVLKSDIAGQEYDKGHMAPADDFKRSQAAIDGTFVMSNIAPQRPKLNQTAWRRLEMLVQKWACGEEDVTIITGPILKAGLPKLRSGISIPDRFFKAIYAKNKSICFIYDQRDDKRVAPEDRVMSVRECEKEIGFDIGPKKAESIEARYDLKDWKQASCRARR